MECALGHFPYPRAQGYWGILQAVLNEPEPSLPAGQYSPELLDFVAHCLRKVRVRVRVRDRVRVRVS